MTSRSAISGSDRMDESRNATNMIPGAPHASARDWIDVTNLCIRPACDYTCGVVVDCRIHGRSEPDRRIAGDGGHSHARDRRTARARVRSRQHAGIRRRRAVRHRRARPAQRGRRFRPQGAAAVRDHRRRQGHDARADGADHEPSARRRIVHRVRQAAPAAAVHPVAVRIQHGQLPATGADQSGSVRCRTGSGHRNRAAANGTRRRSRRREQARIRRRMKLACVVQRYGLDVVGGSESHCRSIAERLAVNHDVTVLTSCAADYLSWKNTYPPGASVVGRVRVLRFPVDRPRDTSHFAELNNIVAGGRATADDEAAWFLENGPQVPALLEHLRAHGQEYDRILFWTYRYYPSYFGVPLVRDRAVLVPTAEEDPVVWLRSVAEFFALPRGYVFLTPEEADLVRSRANGSLPPSCVIGSGLEPVPARSNG